MIKMIRIIYIKCINIIENPNKFLFLSFVYYKNSQDPRQPQSIQRCTDRVEMKRYFCCDCRKCSCPQCWSTRHNGSCSWPWTQPRRSLADFAQSFGNRHAPYQSCRATARTLVCPVRTEIVLVSKILCRITRRPCPAVSRSHKCAGMPG